MKTYYLDYKTSSGDRHMLHKAGCYVMPKIDNCLLLGEFNDPDNLCNYAKGLFPQWEIERCQCCTI